MSDGTEPHPLDDFEFGEATPIDDSRTRAYKPLLRGSVIVAAIAFGLIFVFSLLGNGAPFNSTLQQVCYGVSNVSAMIMLVACCGILFAYRLPHIDPMQIRDGALTARGWMANRFVVLVGLNLIAILMLWASVFFLSGLFGVYFVVPLGLVMLCLTALAATMSVIHRGYLRGYGIGMLAVLFTLMNGNFAMMLVFGPGFGGGMGGVAGYSVGIAAAMTIAPLIGLFCAGYVALIERFSSESE